MENNHLICVIIIIVLVCLLIYFLCNKNSKEYLKCDGLKPIPLQSTEDGYQVIDLISFFQKEQLQFIQLFNNRNENDFYTKKYVTNYQKLFDKYIAI